MVKPHGDWGECPDARQVAPADAEADWQKCVFFEDEMRNWKYCVGAIAILFGLLMSTPPTPAGEMAGAEARPNPPFTLSSVDPCFLAPPTPWGSVLG